MDISGVDLFFSRVLSREEIYEALNVIFKVNAEEVFITKDVSDLSEIVGEEVRILCETSLYVQNECLFPFRIDIYLRDHNLSSVVDDNSFVSLCDLLKCQLLMSGASTSFSSWLLVSAHGSRGVPLDFDAICCEEYLEQYEVK